MNEEIRKALEGLRNFVNFIAELTPTDLDDKIVDFLDFLLGTAAQVRAQALEIPWERLIQILLPYLLKLLEDFLKDSGIGGESVVENLETAVVGRC